MDPNLEADWREPAWIPYDLAAMDVSRRLLVACGRADLHNEERNDANLALVTKRQRDTARNILRKRRVLRLPLDRRRLEAKLRRIVGG